ncbi:MAG TPA: pyridoxamine 5'-phosphate oxidase family protein [Methanocella sp.]|nr:pyridoxamine 5'-phosphate oxidase family protein [Methanocella sp.]
MSREDMLRMLDEERVGRLGLNDTPQPYVVPTDFTFEDGAIYIHTPDGGLKAKLARADPGVCFEVDRYNETVTDFRSVIIRGRIAEVTDASERARAMQSLGRKAAGFNFTAAHRDGGNGAPAPAITIFRIDIQEMTGVKSFGNGH